MSGPVKKRWSARAGTTHVYTWIIQYGDHLDKRGGWTGFGWEGLVSAGFRGGRTCFGWLGGGKDWFWLASGWEGLVSACFRVGRTGFGWFRVGRTGFGWFRLVPHFSNYPTSAPKFGIEGLCALFSNSILKKLLRIPRDFRRKKYTEKVKSKNKFCHIYFTCNSLVFYPR